MIVELVLFLILPLRIIKLKINKQVAIRDEEETKYDKISKMAFAKYKKDINVKKSKIKSKKVSYSL